MGHIPAIGRSAIEGICYAIAIAEHRGDGWLQQEPQIQRSVEAAKPFNAFIFQFALHLPLSGC